MVWGPPPPLRDTLEGQGPQRRPQRRLDRRLEEVAKAVGGSYCRLQMPLKVAPAVRETVAGNRLHPWIPMHPCPPSSPSGAELFKRALGHTHAPWCSSTPSPVFGGGAWYEGRAAFGGLALPRAFGKQ